MDILFQGSKEALLGTGKTRVIKIKIRVGTRTRVWKNSGFMSITTKGIMYMRRQRELGSFLLNFT